MESLDNTDWDVVIVGTGLPQSLLALSLSRSGKKILHLDQNDYYGGNEAALSLQEADEWVKAHGSGCSKFTTYSNASVQNYTNPHEDASSQRLGSSRAYSLALAPQIIYAQTSIIPALVSSRVDQQLEFQAVGSFFVLEPAPPAFSLSRLSKVPSSREDIFSDNGFAPGLKAKRALMKFLRFIQARASEAEALADTSVDQSSSNQGVALTEEEKIMPLSAFLEKRFGLPSSSHGPLLALTLSSYGAEEVLTEPALKRLERHMKSMGVFGPGFGAVIPKWGGLAEIAQVACRACAVGGGVYCLGKGIKSFSPPVANDTSLSERCKLELEGGERVSASWIVGTADTLPTDQNNQSVDGLFERLSKSISIISAPLASLFRPTSEGGVTPAGTVVVVPGDKENNTPVHLMVHSSESGECPNGQSIVYASTPTSSNPDMDATRLEKAISCLLQNVEDKPVASVLWRMNWLQAIPVSKVSSADALSVPHKTLVLPSLGLDLAMEEEVLTGVKEAWEKITGDPTESFLVFESREAGNDNDDNV